MTLVVVVATHPGESAVGKGYHLEEEADKDDLIDGHQPSFHGCVLEVQHTRHHHSPINLFLLLCNFFRNHQLRVFRSSEGAEEQQ